MQADPRNDRLPGSDHPLAILAAGHERLEAQLEALRGLCAHLPTHGCDEQAQQAATNAVHYFDAAVRLKHEDEKRDLLPSLMAAALGENTKRVELLMQQVERQHRDMEQAWMLLKGSLTTISHGEPASVSETEVGHFVVSCRAHITLEKKELIPLAMVLLTEPELRVIGRSMAHRRGVQPRASLRTFEVYQ
jgi:hypothetical protein